jgi:hypothetical protein
MPDPNAAWRAQRQRRWTRENAHLYLRPNAERFFKPTAQLSAKGATQGLRLYRYERPDSAERKYSPDQPRVPAGNPDGGQWTSGTASNSGGATARDITANKPDKDTGNEANADSWKASIASRWPDGSLRTQIAVNPDTAIIRAEFSRPGDGSPWDERYTVLTKEGSATIENAGGVQTVRDGDGNVAAKTEWTASGPEAVATLQTVQLAQGTVVAGRAAIAGVAALYGWWSSQNNSGTQAVLSFTAASFTPGATANDSAVRVDQLSPEEVAQACPRYSEVKSIADQAAQLIDRGAYPSAATYGTAVHKWIADQINGPATTPRSEPRDPDFRAEYSVLKSKDAGYGQLGSKRIDVYENPRNGNVCIYDIKTGKAGLSPGRMLEIASNTAFLYPGTQKIFIMEVRPGR